MSEPKGKISRKEIAMLQGRMDDFSFAELEVGAGKGRFLIERAKENPGTLFVAVEIRIKFADIMSSKVKENSLENFLVLKDDIRNIYMHVLTGDSLFNRVFINFPDPWWKRRHDRRYLANEDVLEHVVRTLKSGGELFMQTDVFIRAKAMLRVLTEHSHLKNFAGEGGFVEESPFRQKTGREKTCQDLGLPIFRLYFRKI